jgi:hypothetical protein
MRNGKTFSLRIHKEDSPGSLAEKIFTPSHGNHMATIELANGGLFVYDISEVLGFELALVPGTGGVEKDEE